MPSEVKKFEESITSKKFECRRVFFYILLICANLGSIIIFSANLYHPSVFTD